MSSASAAIPVVLFLNDVPSEPLNTRLTRHRLSEAQYSGFSKEKHEAQCATTTSDEVVLYAHGGETENNELMTRFAEWLVTHGRDGTRYYLQMCWSKQTLALALVAVLQRRGHTRSKVYGNRGETFSSLMLQARTRTRDWRHVRPDHGLEEVKLV